MPKAILNGTVIAESDATEVVEGNHYFPPDSVKKEFLTPERDPDRVSVEGHGELLHRLCQRPAKCGRRVVLPGSEGRR